MAYIPHPLNTEQVSLSDDIRELTELLAKNTHDIWAKQRFAEGWRYGPKRDDAHKEHPCLVPYEQLSEIEKQYDRNTALETLKLLIALGYKVVKQG
ncbi:MAG TPA: RyR domain-containing protein [Chthonomonadaceae bacterium]|nr:RyR domain-containing protein [Chthonomonadaceae bacterium]